MRYRHFNGFLLPPLAMTGFSAPTEAILLPCIRGGRLRNFF